MSRESAYVNKYERKEQDGVHKWLVFVSAYVTIALTVGFCFAIGSLFLAIMEEFEATRAQAAVIQSTALAFFSGTGIVAGTIVRKFGSRNAGLIGSLCFSLGITASYFASSIAFLVSTLSIVAGVGTSFSLISASTATEKLFEGKRKLVILSIICSGSGVGGMIYPYFLAYLNDVYGLNGALLLVGVICAHSIPCSLLWINHGPTIYTLKDNNNAQGNSLSKEEFVAPKSNNHYRGDVAIERGTHDNKAFDNNNNERISYGKSDGVRNNRLPFFENKCNTDDKTKSLTACESIIDLLKNKTFLSFMIALAISQPTFTVPFIFIVDIFIDKGYTETDANLGLLFLNVLGIFGRLYPAFIVRFSKVPTIGAPIIASFVGFLSMLGLTMLPNVKTLQLSCAVIGFCHGISIAALVVLPAKLFGRENLPTALGLLYSSIGVGNVAVGPVSGMIRDSFSSYNVPLYSAAGCQIVAGGMFIMAHVLRRRARKSEERIRRGSVFYVTKL